MTDPLSPERLTEIQARAGRICRCDDDDCVADLIQLGDKDVPALVAEVKRLTGDLAKYVGWEPTVREEYEHACGQLAAVTEIVREFNAGRGLSEDPLTLASNTDALLAALKTTLGI
jgi:hypothetical protein